MTSLSPARSARQYRYYDLLMAAFVAVLLCSNLIGPAKICRVLGVAFGAGSLFFPISYVFGDILTEVYGYARARKVIWIGFAAQVFAALMGLAVVHMPADPGNDPDLQSALTLVFGRTWRVVLASILAYWAGDFSNSYVMAKMKILTRGRFLWSRTIGSTVVGQVVDSAIFLPLAFLGIWPAEALVRVMVFTCIFKICVEVVLTPLTYLVVNWLKRVEREDYYDYQTNFTPFSLQD